MLSGRTCPSTVVLAVSVSLISGAIGQTLVVKPNCGKPGTSVLITGSGWAEPQPVCYYKFLFDGTEFAPRQDDGLFGPPNTTGTVPAGAAVGASVIKTELRLTGSDQLLQCRQTNFLVVAKSNDPWKDGTGGVTPAGGSITIKFDPSGVCDVTPCLSLVFIQTRMVTGVKNDGTTRRVSYVEQGWDHGADIDKDFTAAGVAIDRIWGKAVPYYGIPAGAATEGFSGQPAPNSDKTSSMEDQPSRSDDSYPADIKTLKIDFETAVFCRSGDDIGEYFGKVTWHWSRDKGSAAVTGSVTADAPTRDAPSQNLLDALALWATNHGFTVPKQVAPVNMGQACK